MGAKRPPGAQLGEETARAMILSGAARVFAERGVRTPTVEDLLRASGVSRRTYYRLYTSKEDVVLALYTFGTDLLLTSCADAVAQDDDPVAQLERCAEVHLRTAKDMGRLVYVLSGEAQAPDTRLHARLQETYRRIVALVQPSIDAWAGRAVDPLVLHALVLAFDGMVRLLLAEADEGRDVTEASLDRARRVVKRLVEATLAAEGPRVAPLPPATAAALP